MQTSDPSKEKRNEEFEFFIDDDYDIPANDDDFFEIVSGQIHKRPQNEAYGLNLNMSSRVETTSNDDRVNSDYNSDSDILVDNSSDDDMAVRIKKRVCAEFNVARNRYNPKFEVGMQFTSFKEFKEAAINWGIKNRRQIYFHKNDKERCQVRCYSEKKPPKDKCSFYMWASKVSKQDPTVQIKTLQLNHSCPMVFDNFHMNAEWLAKYYIDRFRADNNWHEDGIIATIRADHGYKISHTKAWRVRKKALNWIYGEDEDQYKKLWSYGMDLKKTNPGSTIILWRDLGHFRGFYVCLNPLKEAFKKYLRQIICVDGCHLTGNYEGQLLSAVGIDPNDCIFPIAWAVVNRETRETWTWFLSLLSNDLELESGHRISFMSDRQKGLINAIKELFPNAEHRNCVRHMYVNFRRKFMGKELKDLVWNAAKASYPEKFEKWMKEIETKDKEAREWFNHPDRPIESWSRAFFKEETKCDILLNNMCECFNAYILDTRKKAIITMLELIKDRVMERLHKKSTMATRWKQTICPKVARKLEKASMYTTLYIPSYNGHAEIRLDGGDGSHICDLEKKTCTCRRWQLTGLPCTHALCAIRFNGNNIEEFVDNYYKVDIYKKVYSTFINHTNNEEFWPIDLTIGQVIPPPVKEKKRGRPTTKRRMETEEIERQAINEKIEKFRKRLIANQESSSSGQPITNEDTNSRKKLSKKGSRGITCSCCGEKGHNKQYCPMRTKTTDNSRAGNITDYVEGEEAFQGDEFMMLNGIELREDNRDEDNGVVTQAM